MIKLRFELELPKELESEYEGKHLRITNLQDWSKTKVFVDGKIVTGIIQGINIMLFVGDLTKVTIDFLEPPKKKK